MDEWMNGWMDEWMNGWMDEWMNGWMNWMNEWMDVLPWFCRSWFIHAMRIRDALPQWQKTGIMNPGTPGVIIQAYNVLLFDRTLSEVEPSKRHTSNGLVPKNKEETVSHYPRERESYWVWIFCFRKLAINQLFKEACNTMPLLCLAYVFLIPSSKLR